MGDVREPSLDESLPFEEIFAAVQRGDVTAQELAVRRVFPRVMTAIRGRFHGERAVDPDDAAVSAFRTILRRGWEFHRDEERIEPKTWDELAGLCLRFAYNKARTAIKKQHRSKEVGHAAGQEDKPAELCDEHEPGPESNLLRNEMLVQVRAAIDRLHEVLDDKERAILRGKLDGLSSRQVQEQLAGRELYLTRSGVDKRWQRNILPKLQRLLADESLGE